MHDVDRSSIRGGVFKEFDMKDVTLSEQLVEDLLRIIEHLKKEEADGVDDPEHIFACARTLRTWMDFQKRRIMCLHLHIPV